MEWTVSEDNQWRQLGSIVNGVLLEARVKAVRAGHMIPAKPPVLPARAAQIANGLANKRLGHGFLDIGPAPKAIRPVQLELPFGIGAAAHSAFEAPRAPRGARLM
jgi:hypothetical protein